MRLPYVPIEDCLKGISEPNRSACFRILNENRALFQTVQGSTHNHQNWPGGYFDHVQEILNIATLFYAVMDAARPMPFKVQDAYLILFLHDIEKPWKYELGTNGELRHKPEFASKADDHAFRTKLVKEYGFELTPEHENALKYVEGEIKDYDPHRRVMGPFAAFCHLCDVTSARIWFDRPSETGDIWAGHKPRKRDALSS